MRSVVIAKANDVRIVEVGEPPPTDDVVLVRTRFCSLLMETAALADGSDPRVAGPDNPLYRGYPMTMAGEVAGEVVEVGWKITSLKPGDRLVTYGPYTEVHSIQPDAWTKLSDDVSWEAGISVPFSSTALHCIRRAKVGIGDNVVVVGQGPMGLLVTRWAAIAGAGRVIACDMVPERLDLAARMGATHTLNPADGDLESAVKDLTAGRGADVAVDAGNTPTTLDLAMRLARDKGRVVVLSFHTRPITVHDITRDFYNKELDVIATRAGGPSAAHESSYIRWSAADNQRLVERYMSDGRFDPSPLLTDRVPLADIDDALHRIRVDKSVVKILAEW